MDVAFRVLVFAVGAVTVALTIGSAVRTVVLPRGVSARLANVLFVGVRQLFRLRLRRVESYEKRDQVMALYGPLSLLWLAASWMAIVLLGYVAMFWALGVTPLRDAFTLSGSSLFTLGFLQPTDLPKVCLAFTEAALGLTLAALLITYLPSLYAAFSRREALVTALEVRAGTPPSGVEMLERFSRINWLDELDDMFAGWEVWFVEVEETHTSLPAVAFFRSPQPDHSWITAAGAVLDGASMVAACFPDNHPRAEVCIRAGYLALRRIADFFGVTYDRDPSPEGPISIGREEFDEVFERLKAVDIPLVDDQDQAWADFVGWRVNYDTVLLNLASLLMAPYAPWSSDRSATFSRVRVLRGKGPAPAPRRNR